MKNKTWRLIKNIETTGAMQMAIDEAITIACSEGKSPPTLRFYSFNPPAITIGHSQSISDFNLDRISKEGFDCVRRITGGTAVLHKNDLVYSLVIPEEFLPHLVIDAYDYLSDGLVNGLKKIGVPAEKRCSDSSKRLSACYLNDNPYDVIVNRRKISGNAQARMKGVVLQHGTIIIEDNLDYLVGCLNLDGQERVSFTKQARKKVTSIEETLREKVPLSKLREAMICGFRNLFSKKNINLEVVGLTAYEQELAEKLYQKKYSAENWRDLR